MGGHPREGEEMPAPCSSALGFWKPLHHFVPRGVNSPVLTARALYSSSGFLHTAHTFINSSFMKPSSNYPDLGGPPGSWPPAGSWPTWMPPWLLPKTVAHISSQGQWEIVQGRQPSGRGPGEVLAEMRFPPVNHQAGKCQSAGNIPNMKPMCWVNHLCPQAQGERTLTQLGTETVVERFHSL